MNRNMTRDELFNRAKTLARQEREAASELISCLAEIDARKLYLEAGFPSLYAFVREELGFSEAATHRRVSAARLSQKAPEVKKMIRDGSLSLSAASRAASHLYQEYKHSKKELGKRETQNLVKDIANKSTREVDGILAERSSLPQAPRKEVQRAISKTDVQLQIVLNRVQIEKLERIKALVSHIDPNMPFADVIDRLADFYLEKNDPIVKAARAVKKATVHSAALNTSVQNSDGSDASKPAPDANSNPSPSGGAPNRRNGRQAVPQRKVNQIYLRSGGECEYRDHLTGKACKSRHRVQVDHIQPVSKGGGNEAGNLQLLCQKHNLAKGDQLPSMTPQQLLSVPRELGSTRRY